MTHPEVARSASTHLRMRHLMEVSLLFAGASRPVLGLKTKIDFTGKPIQSVEERGCRARCRGLRLTSNGRPPKRTIQ
jgi:hypothetical protein